MSIYLYIRSKLYHIPNTCGVYNHYICHIVSVILHLPTYTCASGGPVVKVLDSALLDSRLWKGGEPSTQSAKIIKSILLSGQSNSFNY